MELNELYKKDEIARVIMVQSKSNYKDVTREFCVVRPEDARFGRISEREYRKITSKKKKKWSSQYIPWKTTIFAQSPPETSTTLKSRWPSFEPVILLLLYQTA